jgi:hypothetical protein
MRLARRAAVIGLVLGAIAAPGFACAEERPAPAGPRTTQQPSPMPPRQCICTMEYNPVCGRTADGTEMTFSNPCRARCAGATIIRRGPC